MEDNPDYPLDINEIRDRVTEELERMLSVRDKDGMIKLYQVLFNCVLVSDHEYYEIYKEIPNNGV